MTHDQINRLAKTARSTLFYATVLAILIPFLFIFVWMALSSIKTQKDIFAMPPTWVFTPTLENYAQVLKNAKFARNAVNTLVVATGSTVLGLLVGLPAAYTIARYRQNRLAMAILAARIMPGIGYMMPLFLLFRAVGLLGTHVGLILSHVVMTFPLTVWIMVSFFEDVPQELYDAALVDGSSRTGAFVRIALPITAPGMVAASLLAFITSWNDYKLALVLSNFKTATLPLMASNFVGFANIDWGPLMATATLMTLPVLLVSIVIQKYIVSGLTVGSVKG